MRYDAAAFDTLIRYESLLLSRFRALRCRLR